MASGSQGRCPTHLQGNLTVLALTKKKGAGEVLEKPINYDDLLLAVVQALT